MCESVYLDAVKDGKRKLVLGADVLPEDLLAPFELSFPSTVHKTTQPESRQWPSLKGWPCSYQLFYPLGNPTEALALVSEQPRHLSTSSASVRVQEV